MAKRRPAEAAKTPKELHQKLTAANAVYNPELLKQIACSYTDKNVSPEDEAKLAKESVYCVWRDFLCAYKAAGYPTDTNPDQKVRKTYEDFGDLVCGFEDWWKDEGRELFMEQGQLPLVTVLDIDREWGEVGSYPKYITLQIPLTIPMKGILAQLNAILSQCHLGSDLYRHRHSTAEYKLYPRPQYRKEDFENMLKVWKLVDQHRTNKSEKDKMPWWQIGEEAKLNPKINPHKNTPKANKDEARRDLGKLASNNYRQAKIMMENAIRGVFPWGDALEHDPVASGNG